MANTIAVNKLTICHKGGGGSGVFIVPDVCWTPMGKVVVPIPYPNVAPAKFLDKGSKSVKVDSGNPVGLKSSRLKKSFGDEPGVRGGIISGVNRDEARFITTSPNVKVEGKTVGRFTDLMTLNKKNTIGVFIVGPVIVVETQIEVEDTPLCSVEVKCGHGRKAGKEKILQIVADQTSTIAFDLLQKEIAFEQGGKGAKLSKAGPSVEGVQQETLSASASTAEVHSSDGSGAATTSGSVSHSKSVVLTAGGESIGIRKTREASSRVDHSYNRSGSVTSRTDTYKETDEYAHKKAKEAEKKPKKGLKIQARCHGEDTVTADVKYREGSGLRQVSCQAKSKEPAANLNSGRTSAPKTYTIPTKNHGLWPLNSKPDVYEVTGYGDDGFQDVFSVESYPNENFEVEYSKELKTFPLDTLLKKFEGGINDILDKIVAALPVTAELKFKRPAGKLKAAWGWEEDKNWEACFVLKLEAGLNPLAGASLVIALSGITALGMAFGVPPFIGKFVGKHIADLTLGLEFEVSFSLMGSAKFRYYPYRKGWSPTGSVALTAAGSIALALTLKVGGDSMLSASARGAAKVGISGTVKLEVEVEGVFVKPSAKVDPVTLSLTFKARAFIFSYKNESKWELTEKKEWKGEKLQVLPWE